MSPILMVAVAATMFNLVVHGPPSRFLFWVNVALTGLWCSSFFSHLLDGEQVDAIAAACLAGATAYMAWRSRPPGGKRLADKVTGLVKNLGHRLTVVPVPGGAR